MNPLRRIRVSLASLALAMVPGSAADAQINPFGGRYSQLTADDLRLIEEEVSTLLESGEAGNVASWQNEKSGNFGETGEIISGTVYLILVRSLLKFLSIWN